MAIVSIKVKHCQRVAKIQCVSAFLPKRYQNEFVFYGIKIRFWNPVYRSSTKNSNHKFQYYCTSIGIVFEPNKPSVLTCLTPHLTIRWSVVECFIDLFHIILPALMFHPDYIRFNSAYKQEGPAQKLTYGEMQYVIKSKSHD